MARPKKTREEEAPKVTAKKTAKAVVKSVSKKVQKKDDYKYEPAKPKAVLKKRSLKESLSSVSKKPDVRSEANSDEKYKKEVVQNVIKNEGLKNDASKNFTENGVEVREVFTEVLSGNSRAVEDVVVIREKPVVREYRTYIVETPYNNNSPYNNGAQYNGNITFNNVPYVQNQNFESNIGPEYLDKTDIKNKSEEKKVKKSRGKIFTRSFMFILMLLFLAPVGLYIYNEFFKPAPLTIEEQNKLLVKEIGALVAIPLNEKPSIFEVQDPVKLSSQQPFFNGVSLGDKVLIFPNSNKAVVYNPNKHVIVNMGPITTPGTSTSTSTSTGSTASSTATSTKSTATSTKSIATSTKKVNVINNKSSSVSTTSASSTVR